jgi:glycine/D-amino acid oxidase-like deaminating enzyme
MQVSRRTAIRTGALAFVGGVVAAACDDSSADPAATSSSTAASTTAITTMETVDVANRPVVRQMAGLRPFRSSGFVVRAEQLGDTTIVHNYGHGGCGITLSWGTAKMALDLALATPHRQAAVIGSGVAGLTTARLLQDNGFDVAIHAAALPPDTTSNVAAGVFGVTDIADQFVEPFVSQLQQAARFSHRYFQTFVGRPYGVHWFTLYLLGDTPPQHPPEFAVTPELYPLTQFGPGEHPFATDYAASLPTLIAETNVFLPSLLDEFVARGGTITVQSFADTSEVELLPQPLVLNCTGLGAKELFGDEELTPVKGQLAFLTPQAGLDYGYIDPKNDLYMFPRSDGVVLGGSHQLGEWSTEPDPAVATRIIEGNERILAGR